MRHEFSFSQTGKITPTSPVSWAIIEQHTKILDIDTDAEFMGLLIYLVCGQILRDQTPLLSMLSALVDVV